MIWKRLLKRQGSTNVVLGRSVYANVARINWKFHVTAVTDRVALPRRSSNARPTWRQVLFGWMFVRPRFSSEGLRRASMQTVSGKRAYRSLKNGLARLPSATWHFPAGSGNWIRMPYQGRVQFKMGTYPNPPGIGSDVFFVSIMFIVVSSSFFYWVTHRDVVSITGRSRTMAISIEMERKIADFQFDSMLEGQHVLPNSNVRNLILQRMFKKIILSNSMYTNNLWDWEIRLVEDDTVNAFATFGGKIVCYTGMMDALLVFYLDDEIESPRNALAGVISHECGHSVARHVAEGLSWIVVQIPFFFFSQQSPMLLWLFEYFIQLPFSRACEYEADALGINFMAKSGYDPKDERDLHLALNKSSGLEEFVSTHPVGQNRAESIEKLMPNALLEHQRYLRKGETVEKKEWNSYITALTKSYDTAIELIQPERPRPNWFSVYVF